MTNSIPEYLRKISIESGFNSEPFKETWSIWKPVIQRYVNINASAESVIGLADQLADIFKLTNTGGRSQSSLAGAGFSWEAFVNWYLNICFIGSRAVAVRNISDIPTPIRKALNVNYGTFKSNTEADIIVIIFPNLDIYKTSIDFLETNNNDIIISANSHKRNRAKIKNIIDNLTGAHFEKHEVGIIQCKTNWNDNAQIPMLWGMLYSVHEFKEGSQISIGIDSFSIDQLKKFTYSFVTVPTGKLENYKPSSTAVNRVRNLSGGNYWGHQTKSSIANSLKEIFNYNFSSAFSQSNIRKSIRENIDELDNDLSYFRIT